MSIIHNFQAKEKRLGEKPSLKLWRRWLLGQMFKSCLGNLHAAMQHLPCAPGSGLHSSFQLSSPWGAVPSTWSLPCMQHAETIMQVAASGPGLGRAPYLYRIGRSIGGCIFLLVSFFVLSALLVDKPKMNKGLVVGKGIGGDPWVSATISRYGWCLLGHVYCVKSERFVIELE